MSLKEADRYAVIHQVIERTMRQSDAAFWLNISVLQDKRLVRAIRQDGAQGAVSRRWGVPSNRRISQVVRDQLVGLVRDHYSEFGLTRACEYLTAQHSYSGSAEILRTWMIAAGLWKAKRTRVRRIHSPRTPRSCAGELVQIDFSPHAWFEDRASKSCLIAFIDDATGELMQACFYPVEMQGILEIRFGGSIATLHERDACVDLVMRQSKHLNNIVEQDHRAIKRITRPMLGFKSFWSARNIIAGVETMHMIKKGQMDCPVGYATTAANQFYSLAA